MLNHYLTLTDCRLLASLFSRSNFLRMLKYDDLSRLNTLMRETGCGRSHCRTVNDYLNLAYKQLVRNYPCEYVYKNEFLNRAVLKNRLLRKSAIFNEFRASDSIADFAVFGDSSCAYEIKTKFDSPKRLLKKIDRYAKLFDSVAGDF